MAVLLLLASVALAAMVYLPAGSSTAALLGIVLVVGFLTYAVRGIFWSTLESCDISNHVKGLAIGIISLIGYSPDIYLPLLSGYLIEQNPGKCGYSLYFMIIAAMGLLGALAAWRLKYLVARRALESKG